VAGRGKKKRPLRRRAVTTGKKGKKHTGRVNPHTEKEEKGKCGVNMAGGGEEMVTAHDLLIVGKQRISRTK